MAVARAVIEQVVRRVLAGLAERPSGPAPSPDRGLAVPPATGLPELPQLPDVPPAEAARFFASPEVTAARQQVCEIGRRLWDRAYVDGNGGNVSVRVARDLVLCTPTLVSKGFMRPEQLCLVDLTGAPRAGNPRTTSEIHMHLAIYRAQPRAVACVHAHPPCATGFSVVGVPPPARLLPEMELICGEVPLAPYVTPGGPGLGEVVAPYAAWHSVILMANHGPVAWGSSLEDAYARIEIVESYCRTVLVTERLGLPPNVLSHQELQALLRIKDRMGLPDPRLGQPEPAPDPAAEQLVQRVTEAVAQSLR